MLAVMIFPYNCLYCLRHRLTPQNPNLACYMELLAGSCDTCTNINASRQNIQKRERERGRKRVKDIRICVELRTAYVHIDTSTSTVIRCLFVCSSFSLAEKSINQSDIIFRGRSNRKR
jgi:hypothetical protein